MFSRGETISIEARQGEPPVTCLETLGSGSGATVLKVQVDDTREVCALKVYKARGPTRIFRDKFEAEIQSLKRVPGRHIVGFRGAYIYSRPNQSPEYAILMQPVADGGSLEKLITECRNWPRKISKKRRGILLKSFECLSSALASIHKVKIRHKDVKPSNILLHAGEVLLADF